MAPHSSTLAWKVSWTEEPGGLQSIGSRRVRHDWVTSLSLSCIGEGNGNPLQCSCLENPRDGGASWAAVCGVTQSQTRLMRLRLSKACWATGGSYHQQKNRYQRRNSLGVGKVIALDIYLFNRYLSDTFDIPGTFPLCARNPYLYGAFVLVRETNSKQNRWMNDIM